MVYVLKIIVFAVTFLNMITSKNIFQMYSRHLKKIEWITIDSITNYITLLLNNKVITKKFSNFPVFSTRCLYTVQLSFMV